MLVVASLFMISLVCLESKCSVVTNCVKKFDAKAEVM